MNVTIGPLSVDFWNILSAGIGGGLVFAVQCLSRAITTDVAKRITSSLLAMRAIDRVTPNFLRHAVWSGRWEITWEVESENFEHQNRHRASLYRCFNAIALEGIGITTTGMQIPYGFIGKLSRDKTIATGTWFDRRGGDGGYHGAYQMRISGTGDRAKGLWCGFSETGPEVKSGNLIWIKSL